MGCACEAFWGIKTAHIMSHWLHCEKKNGGYIFNSIEKYINLCSLFVHAKPYPAKNCTHKIVDSRTGKVLSALPNIKIFVFTQEKKRQRAKRVERAEKYHYIEIMLSRIMQKLA